MMQQLWRPLQNGALVDLYSHRWSNLHPRKLQQVRPLCCSKSSVVVAEQKEEALEKDRAREADELKFEGVVDSEVSKARLDQWLSRQLPRVSRARLQNSIRSGLALVNSQPISKASFTVKRGDFVECKLVATAPSEAVPEDIPLEIIFEDEHLIVINKPADMVVHPAPGHYKGTLVNALLHHCQLPAMEVVAGTSNFRKGHSETSDEEFDEDDDADEVVGGGSSSRLVWRGPLPVIRPGIVHRLDKGTSGLLVVAKDEYTHENLCDQFKARSVKRSYLSLLCGCPALDIGRVDVSIGRDLRDRKRMAAFPVSNVNSRARSAASKYRLLEVLAQGGCALVEWRLETGRTHQIRVHAQYLGHSLLGDELYGGTKRAAEAKLLPLFPPAKHGQLRHMLAQLYRPCLHAQTLGFVHPWTREELNFCSPPPEDFATVLELLRLYGTIQV